MSESHPPLSEQELEIFQTITGGEKFTDSDLRALYWLRERRGGFSPIPWEDPSVRAYHMLAFSGVSRDEAAEWLAAKVPDLTPRAAVVAITEAAFWWGHWYDDRPVVRHGVGLTLWVLARLRLWP